MTRRLSCESDVKTVQKNSFFFGELKYVDVMPDCGLMAHLFGVEWNAGQSQAAKR